MDRTHKLLAGIVLLVFGLGLIGWNLRDPDRAYREQPKQIRVVTLEQVPLAVQATAKRMSIGSKIGEVQEKHQNGTTWYEVDAIRGETRTEIKIAEDGSVIKQKARKVKKEKPPATAH
jgi:hypothetical protein